MRPVYEELAERVEKILAEILTIEKINYAVIQHRAKTIESFQIKLKEINYSDKNLPDLAGIRVVGYVRSDVEKIIQIIKEHFDVDEIKSKDKSTELSPDRFGYRAIHLVCKLPKARTVLPEYKKFKDIIFEIQVKTILEHAWAQIEHDRNYKYKGLPKNIQRDFYLIAGSLEIADEKFELINKRIEEYNNDIKLKTEQGKLEEIDINPATLKRYLIDKFADKFNLEKSYGFDGTGMIEVNELLHFDVKNLAQLEKIIHPKLSEIDKVVEGSEDTNLTGLIYSILILKYGKEYGVVAKESRHSPTVDFRESLKKYQNAIALVEK